MASSSGLTALLIIGVGVGGYALFRYLEDEKHKGGGGGHHGKGHAAARGYFTGAAPHGVDYLNPADAMSDRRPAHNYLVKPYQILNVGAGVRPYEVDAHGEPTGRQIVLPGETPMGAPPGGYVLVGQGVAKAVDPRNCLCPQSLDPLDASLPTYKCPCNVPGAVRPPYAGYMAGLRGGGHQFHQRMQHQQQQQQDQQQSGPPEQPYDPSQPPPFPQQPPQQPPLSFHPHHGRRR